MNRSRRLLGTLAAAVVLLVGVAGCVDTGSRLAEQVVENGGPYTQGAEVGTVSHGMPWTSGVVITLYVPEAATITKQELADEMLAAFETGWLEASFDPQDVTVCPIGMAKPTPKPEPGESDGSYKYEITPPDPELVALLPEAVEGLANSCFWTLSAFALEELFGPRS